jgi:hypothetical protein
MSGRIVQPEEAYLELATVRAIIDWLPQQAASSSHESFMST